MVFAILKEGSSVSQRDTIVTNWNTRYDRSNCHGFHWYIFFSTLDGVIVTTTHPGVKDSKLQKDASYPVFHNHYVKLETDRSGLCKDLKVGDLRFESPGHVSVLQRFVAMKDLPFSFSGTSAKTHDPLTISPGGNVDDVVSFTLEPKFVDGNLKAVCVNNIMPAEHLTVRD